MTKQKLSDSWHEGETGCPLGIKCVDCPHVKKETKKQDAYTPICYKEEDDGS